MQLFNLGNRLSDLSFYCFSRTVCAFLEIWQVPFYLTRSYYRISKSFAKEVILVLLSNGYALWYQSLNLWRCFTDKFPHSL